MKFFSRTLRNLTKAMGKRRRKKERDERSRAKELRMILAEFEPESLLRLLFAGASSPTCRHRSVSIGALIDLTLRETPVGTREALAIDLVSLVDAAAALDPGIASMEDYVPLDPRERVLLPSAGQLFRIFPGARERPIADFGRSTRISSLIDSVLIDEKGFGLEDVIELSTRFTGDAISHLLSHWSDREIRSYRDPVSLSQGEVDAVRDIPEIRTQIQKCRHPERAAIALEWATVEAQSIRFDATDPNSSFGASLAISRPDESFWAVPLAFQPDGVAEATRRLATFAAGKSAELDSQFASLTETLVLEHLRRSHSVMRTPAAGSVGRITGIAIAAEKHALIVDSFASLDSEHLPQLMLSAIEKVAAIRAGTLVALGSQSHRIPPDCEVVPVVIGAGPAAAMTPPLPGCGTMTIDDLQWIVSSSDDPADFYFFCRELAMQPGLKGLFSFETANAWEYWRANNKALHRTAGGMPMMIRAHHTDAEWKRHAQRSWIEELLHRFNLPALQDWTDLREDQDDQEVDLVDKFKPAGWKLSRNPFPLAIQVVADELLQADFSWVPSVGGALQFKVTHLDSKADVVKELAATLAEGLLVRFKRINPIPDEWPLRLESAEDGIIELGVDERCPDVEIVQPGALEALLGFYFTEGLERIGSIDEDRRIAFLHEWITVQKALSMDPYYIPQRIQHPDEPLQSHSSVRSGSLRDLAEELREKGVQPGRFVGDAAVAFENDNIFPSLKAFVQDRWAVFSPQAILKVATRELERAAAKRKHERQQLYFNVSQMPVTFDPVARSTKLREESSRLTRAITTVIELLLREPPLGTKAPDEIDWRSILTICDLMLESALRSEAAHYGLAPVETDLSNRFEISTRNINTQSGFDYEAFQVATSRFEMAQAMAPEDHPNPESQVGLIATFPELASIDDGFLAEHGCGLETFLRTLAVLREVDVPEHTLVARITPSDLVDWCSSQTGDPIDQVDAAIRLLTLTAVDLRSSPFEPWAFRERDARLVTRPLIADLASSNIHVLPWWADQAFEVYERYIRSGGRLPWKDVGSGPLKQALDDYRSKRNRQLEDDVAALFEDRNVPLRVRIKKAPVLGMSKLSGEIDTIVADLRRRTLWILEVKDPAEGFSVAEISRSIRAFFDPGGFLEKLIRKVEDVNSEKGSVVRLLTGLKEDDWNVEGAIVTRRPVPAAYVSPSPLPMVTVDAVVDLVLGSGTSH